MNFVKTSYSPDDVTVLLQDVRGQVPILDTKERERLNQSGVHYSEMLPLEYVPTDEYFELYNNSLKTLAADTALATKALADKIIAKHPNPVIVSLARAGTPIGILLRHEFKKMNVDAPHYTISIIRGKGIDIAAMNYIIKRHDAKDIVFVDGWVGKGAIARVLEDAVSDLKSHSSAFDGLSAELAVLSDPASVTDLYGTRQDFLIPSACLNATVSGLFSRTVKTQSMTDDELHGAVYYYKNEDADVSNQFIQAVLGADTSDVTLVPSEAEADETFKGIDEVREIAERFGINDINKIKPGVGETTRVLLRRVPDRILIREDAPAKYTANIMQLAKEKNIPVEIYPFKKYNVCGIIKDVADL